MDKKLIKTGIIIGSIVGLTCLGTYVYNEALPNSVLKGVGDVEAVFSETSYNYQLSYHNGEVTAKIKGDNIRTDDKARYALIFAPNDILSIELLDKNGYPIKIISFDTLDITIVQDNLRAVKKVKMGAKEVLQVSNSSFNTRKVLVKE